MSEILNIELERDFDGENILIALEDVAKYKNLEIITRESFDVPIIIFRTTKQPSYIEKPYKSTRIEFLHKESRGVFADLDIDKHKSYQKLELKIRAAYDISQVLSIITDYFDNVNNYLINSFKKSKLNPKPSS